MFSCNTIQHLDIYIFSELYFVAFSRYDIEKKSGRRRFNAYVPSVYVFSCKIEWKQEKTTTYMSLRRDFALSLILGLQNALFCVISSVASTHPTFIIRDINIYRNSYSTGLLKSRKSDHCCFNIQIVFKIHHKPLRHLELRR